MAGARQVPADTSESAHRRQGEIYRRMGGAARVAIAFDLSDLTRRLTMAGIRRRHPGYTAEQIDAAWARIILGDDTTRAVWPGRPLVEP